MKNLRFITTIILFITFWMSVSAAFLPIKVTPADGATVDKLSKISTEWPGEWLEDQSYDTCGIVTDNEGNEVTTITCEIDFMDPICDFYLEDPITEKGRYTVKIYANCVQSEDEEWNSEFELTYTVGDDAEIEPIRFIDSDPSNGATLSSLSTIETTWNEVAASISTDISVSVQDEDGEEIGIMTARKSVFSSSPIVYLSLDTPIEKDGDYTIVLPEGVLIGQNGELSEEVRLTYKVDSTTSINELGLSNSIVISGKKILLQEEGMLIIYGIDGIVVAVLNSNDYTYVPAGVYVAKLYKGSHIISQKLNIR